MPGFVLLIVALALGACTTGDAYVHRPEGVTSGNWKIERQPDPITGKAVASAMVRTMTSSNSNEPFGRQAMLQLTCFKDSPMIVFAFAFRVGSTPNSFLGYRFDEKPGRDVNARFLLTQNTVVIEDLPEVVLFANDLATASLLRIRIRSLNAGRTTAEFQVAGGPEAIKAGFADCPLPPERARRSKTS